jgi:hypothetical protein
MKFSEAQIEQAFIEIIGNEEIPDQHLNWTVD